MSALFDLEDLLDDETPQAETRQGRREKRRWKAKKTKPNQKPKEPKYRVNKATIKATAKMRREEFVRGQRAHSLAIPTRHDASLITNHVAKQENEEISGDSLEELYAQLAVEVLHDLSDDGAHRAKIAVTYACCSEWLTRFEENTGARWHYAIPQLPFDEEDIDQLAA